MTGHEVRTRRLQGVDGSEWTIIGTIEGSEGVELSPNADEGVYTAPVNTALPRELSMSFTLNEFDTEAWNAAQEAWIASEKRFREHLQLLADGIREAAEQIAEQLPAFEAAKKAVKSIQQPSKTPPFWAHNPAKQKRPR